MDKYAAIISMMAYWSLLALGVLALSSAWLSSDHSLRRGAAVLLLGLVLLGGWVALWYYWLIGGYAEFKEPSLPLDFVRPGTLVLFGGLLGVGGVWLLLQGIRIAKQSAEQTVGQVVHSPVGVRNASMRYGQVARFLHWSMGIGILALVVMGVFMAGLPDEHGARVPLILLHKTIGMTLLVLAFVRAWWMFRDPAPALVSTLTKGQYWLATTVHYSLLVCVFAFPLSGWLMSNTVGKATYFLWWRVPDLLAADESLVLWFGLSHKMIVPLVFYLLIAAHLAGVIKHHFVNREPEAIRRMAL